jgi:hypothetical protein
MTSSLGPPPRPYKLIRIEPADTYSSLRFLFYGFLPGASRPLTNSADAYSSTRFLFYVFLPGASRAPYKLIRIEPAVRTLTQTEAVQMENVLDRGEVRGEGGQYLEINTL